MRCVTWGMPKKNTRRGRGNGRTVEGLLQWGHPARTKEKSLNAKCVQTQSNGCGGPVCVVVQYRFPRPKRRISNQPVA